MNTEEAIKKEAKKYGVPTPELCKKMNVPYKKVNHYWIDCKYDAGISVCNFSELNTLDYNGTRFKKIASALQVHEIIDEILKIVTDDEFDDFEMLLDEDINLVNDTLYFPCNSDNIANKLASVYIKLKHLKNEKT